MTVADRDLFYFDANGRQRLLARKGQPIPEGYDPATAVAPVRKAVKARRKPEDKAAPAPAPTVEDAPVVDDEPAAEDAE